MGFVRRVIAGIRALFAADSEGREIEAEVEHFMAEEIAELERAGVDPREARREVRARWGSETAVREEVRRADWEHQIDVLFSDLRLAARRARKDALFTFVVVATIALGIGATAAVLSVVGPVLVYPLPYPEPDRLVSVGEESPEAADVPVTFGTWLEVRDRTPEFEHVAVGRRWEPGLSGIGDPERLSGRAVSSEWFDVLGVPPALGPGWTEADDRPDATPLVVVSDAFWRTRLGESRGAIGTHLRLDGVDHRIAGVLPAGIRPLDGLDTQVWTLLRYDRNVSNFETREWGRHLEMIARLRPGVSIDAARAALARVSGTPESAYPRPEWARLEAGFRVRDLAEATNASIRPATGVLAGAVALLLLVTCANLTMLLLARAHRRRGEFAMRSALGAGRGRMVRHLATEGMLLAAIGGGAGLLLARGLLEVAVRWGPAELVQSNVTGLDPFALLAAFGLTAVLGIVIGSVPAFAASGRGSAGATRTVGRGHVGGLGRARRAMVVVEVAVAVVLLTGTGLLLRTATQLFGSPRGFAAGDAVVFQVQGNSLSGGDAGIHAFFDRAEEAIRAIPGVRDVATSSQFPLTGEADVYGVEVVGETDATAVDGSAFRYAVSDEWFGSMGIPLRSGRAPLRGEPERPAVLSASLARGLFGGENPIGRRIRFGPRALEPFTVVGVAEDVKQVSLESTESAGIYVSSSDWHWADRVRWFVVRADRPIAELAPELRRAVWSVDASPPIVGMQTVARLAADSEARRRFVLFGLIAFAIATLVLAALGLHGVVASIVQDRRREMAVRLALGASPEGVHAFVVRQGLSLTLLGVVLGTGVAGLASGAVSRLLFEVSRLDPWSYLAAAGCMTGVALLACWMPASRAARSDVSDCLRAD